jgi:3-oxoadipate enol-lactonase
MGPNRTADAVERAAKANAALHVDSYIKTVRASASYNRVANLPNIRVPVLLVFGDVDPLTPPHVGEYMRERIVGSRLVIIEDAGHMTNLERPQAFNAAVMEFLLQQK